MVDLNIQNKISNFSYIDSNKNLIYLEEDVDMVLFFKSYKEKYNKGLTYVVENNFEIHRIIFQNIYCTQKTIREIE